MAEEIVINVSPHETRVAVVENGLLQEIFVERTHTRSTVGNIYKGKIVRILPGMQSAFVAIGQEKAAFMHITDVVEATGNPDHRLSHKDLPPIVSILHEGKELLVQVSKEPIGTKGARITSNISFASRYLVYMPNSNHVGISQRIEDEEERERLRGLLHEVGAGETDGFIVRTASEGISGEEICRDAKLLRARWRKVQEEAGETEPERLVYEDLPLPLRAMRDIINAGTQRIVVDDKDLHDALSRFLTDFIPDKLNSLCLTETDSQLFATHNLEDQIEQALDQQVPLKSGGYLIIDQTEAMTTVDVNTGAFVGRKDLEETIYRTNLEAALAIPRQLRLRNIGGIVIIDFIDMLDEEHKRQVLRTLEKGQQADRVKWNISQISDLGLVEMTRKRTRESLMKMLCEPCETCNGRGFIKSAESVCPEIFRDITAQRSDFERGGCLVMASQSVVDRLIDEDADVVKSLSGLIGVPIRIEVESSYNQEQFDVVVTRA